MATYRKIATIEAVQITDDTFDAPHPNPTHVPGVVYDPTTRTVRIETLEGVMSAGIGDWIATGVNGEHWPIKADVFAKSYVVVEP